MARLLFSALLLSAIVLLIPVKTCASTTPGWAVSTVEYTGIADKPTYIAMTSNGIINVLYNSGATWLKLATMESGVWRKQNVLAAGAACSYYDLAIGTNDLPYVCAVDSTGSILTYLTCESSGTWYSQTIESGAVYCSMALNSSNIPYISYIKSLKLKCASWESSSKTWITQTVSTADSRATSIAIDSNGNPYISYCGSFGSAGSDLFCASWESASNKWIISEIGGGVGVNSSLAMDSSNNPHISSHSPGYSLIYVSWEAVSKKWLGVTISTATYATSLALDSNDKPYVAFSYLSPTYGLSLKYARNYPSGTWETSFVDTPEVASYQTGKNPCILIDKRPGKNNKKYISFYKPIPDYMVKVAIQDSSPPVVTVEAPNLAGITLEGNYQYLISWEATDDAVFPPNNYILIYYTSNEGASWITITTNESNDISSSAGNYLWTVPNGFDSTNCRVSVEARDMANNKGFDISDNKFRIISNFAPLVTVEAPNSPGLTFEVGEKYVINWKATDNGGFPADKYISIYYSTNGGSTWTTILTTESNEPASSVGTYEWTVPSVSPSINCLISVEAKDTTGLKGRDISDYRFSIVASSTPLVTVEAPNLGAITLEGGDKYIISWEARDNGGFPSADYISIYLTTNEGSSWTTLTTTEENDPGTISGTFEWTVPYVNSSNCRISVEAKDEANNKGRDISNYKFTITAKSPPLVTVEAPTASGITLEEDLKYIIRWSATDNLPLPSNDNISIYLTTNEGASWMTITTTEENDPGTNSGTFEWTVPGFNTSECLISVEVLDSSATTGSDVSDNLFRIVRKAFPLVTVEAPSDAGITLEGNSQYLISWEATDNGGFPTADYINVFLSTNEGATWMTLATTEENDPSSNSGTYDWKVLNINSDKCLISVEARDLAGHSAYDISNNKFKISSQSPPLVTVEAPTAAGITLEGGSKYVISWEAKDNVSFPGSDYISIYLTTNNGTTWSTLTTTEENDPGTNSGTYEWTVYNVSSTNCRISVEARDALGNKGFDISDNKFTITVNQSPLVTVTAPNAPNITLEEGGTYIISWDATDNLPLPTSDNISIFLSTNGGSSWSALTNLEENDPGLNSGLYNWTIPGGINSSTCLISVEVTDSSSNVGRDISNYFFTIVPNLPPVVTVEFPSDPVSFEGGGKYIISWEATDNGGLSASDYISIWFSTDYGATWTTITTTDENLPGQNHGLCHWTVPMVGNFVGMCLVSVEARDKLGNFADDVSDNYFSIVTYRNPVVTIETPSDPGIVLIGRENYTINWRATDNIGFRPTDYLTIYLTTNECASWTVITTLEENDPGFITGSYDWRIPNVSSESCRISIEGIDLASYIGFDISDNDFSIMSTTEGLHPTIEAIYINGIRFMDKDIISSNVDSIWVDITDMYGCSSVELDILSTPQKVYFYPISGNAYDGRWCAYAPFKIRDNPYPINSHILVFTAANVDGGVTVEMYSAVVMTGQVEVVGTPLNYPNPFKPLSGQGATNIQYTLSRDGPVSLIIYDMTGHEVRRIISQTGHNGGRAGLNTVSWNGRSFYESVVGNGMYVYKIINDNRVIGTGKIVIYDD